MTFFDKYEPLPAEPDDFLEKREKCRKLVVQNSSGPVVTVLIRFDTKPVTDFLNRLRATQERYLGINIIVE